MSLLDEKTRADVAKLLDELAGPVQVLLFTQTEDCQFCEETQTLLEEVASTSEQVTLQVFDAGDEQTATFNIDKFPAIAMLGADGQDYGVRYFGIPSGYEFSSLMHDLKAVAAGPEGISLDADTLAYLENLENPVHLQVFVTPSCPYCPQAVTLAHEMAIASDKVRADMVEAMEFTELSAKYQVMGVPRTVINETEFVEGAVPAPMLLAKIKAAANALNVAS